MNRTFEDRQTSDRGEVDGLLRERQIGHIRQAGQDMISLLFAIDRENGHSSATHEINLAVQKVQEAVMWGIEAIEEA
jgi:hypothetical protein